MVGTSNQSMCFIFYYHSFRNSSSFILFYSGSRCLSSLMRCCSVSGADLSNMATEQTTAHSCKALNPGSVRLYQNGYEGNSFWRLAALNILPLYIRLAAIILFIVRVPVLSEQIQVVQPKVQTACRFLASTFFFASLFAVNVNEMVTSNSNPFGTFATVIPMAKVRAFITSNPIAKPTDSTIMPKQTAAKPSR